MPAKGWVETPPPEPVYAGMWACYRDGARATNALARRAGVSYRMAYTAVHRGWPANKWPALAERWKLFERQADAARARELENDRQAAETAGKTSAARWRDYQAKWLPVMDMAPEIVGELGRKLKQAVALATFTQYRKVKQIVNGKEVKVDQLYVNGADVARATQLWVQAFKESPAAMRYLLGVGVDAPEPQVPDLTPEQQASLDRGEMPSGMTAGMLGALLLQQANKTGSEP